MVFSDAQLLAWIQQYFWPFVRISALLMIMPVLGVRTVPVRVRILLTVLLTIIVAPLLPATPAVEVFSAAGLGILVQQMLIGLIAGFVLVLVFESVVLGAGLIAHGMGLSFAQLADPLRGVTTPVTGQFLTILATLLFIALHGHLIAIGMLVDSFATLPVAALALDADTVRRVVAFSGIVFVGGLQLALPVIIALLTVNLAMGVVSRSAPSMHLFAVGFPVTLLSGLVLLRAGLPAINEAITGLFDQSWVVLRRLLGG
ncbi:flagellar biosynthetic protein FliR [Sinimarinibacterium sp. NLF-5-8]|uniref:flagellar biosynthetic protein FliR n=1 Tax=Sinimarinibacterium sp. NLF-5-8 TaxID=2698684 RepID=UPI00137C111F|nr:flagellar biosynthetic protein FliR [Sinimarinibacterium sp. NLF-5-8]QHS09252.1 flagellar biosynthetic protein FliR [Sinimarinibacterium sp. NLF-5-8]